MSKYLEIFLNGYTDYFNYLKSELLSISWHNYFYFLIFISLFFWLLEIAIPWRKKQSIIRKDFWLDAFYMFFNFFLFNLLIFYSLVSITNGLITDILSQYDINSIVIFKIDKFPYILQLLVYFLVRDFVHFNVHRLLHRYKFLWKFHKVHHSVKEMGFAAHLRFHWLETFVYRIVEFIPLAIIGFGVQDFIIIHFIAVAIGHFNHSNFKLNLGVLKYILNNPQMHIWHHAKELHNRYGVNYGISLSLWDYLFKTDYIPSEGRDIELGFQYDEVFPKTFLKQFIYPLKKI